MKIFSAKQIRKGDQYTIDHEPIKSIYLMERAARQCANWIRATFPKDSAFYVFCGVGNNAGDGFALARLLSNKGFYVKTFTVLFSDHFSEDCSINKRKFKQTYPKRALEIKNILDFPSIPEKTILIDALFGTGMNRPLKGLVKKVVQKINTQSHLVISIDMPSGLQAENNPIDKIAIKADHTLSFEFKKLAFFFKENSAFVGEVHVLPIGIHSEYIRKTKTPYRITSAPYISENLKKRAPFSHKGTYGHALLIAGSYGKMGAAVLTTQANVKSGIGLTTVYCPRCGYNILQSSVPEAMCLTDENEFLLTRFPDEKPAINVLGIGPGIGTQKETQQMLHSALKKDLPMVLDADALNILSENPKWLSEIPKGSILTPHPKEFERLFGKSANSYERLQLQREKSKLLQVTILLKGHYTSVSDSEGHVWFNTTGHAGMATGGSGDVLTGIVTGLLGQGYSAPQSAILGAWLHGKSGDLAVIQSESKESMSAHSLISHLGKAFNAAHHLAEIS